ncbi:hypothetical protein, partial [Acinetobacter variabilis]|uniref:hypothetical protein n=1 Tax=Acinetobacter variabilis TaxID=70346 RepID=UPI003BF58717
DGPFQQKRGGINDQLDTFLHAVVSVLEVRMIGKQRRRSAAIDVPFLRKPAMMSAGCQSMKLLSIFPHSLN